MRRQGMSRSVWSAPWSARTCPCFVSRRQVASNGKRRYVAALARFDCGFALLGSLRIFAAETFSPPVPLLDGNLPFMLTDGFMQVYRVVHRPPWESAASGRCPRRAVRKARLAGSAAGGASNACRRRRISERRQAKDSSRAWPASRAQRSGFLCRPRSYQVVLRNPVTYGRPIPMKRHHWPDGMSGC
jgi:hypothetical protein